MIYPTSMTQARETSQSGAGHVRQAAKRFIGAISVLLLMSSRDGPEIEAFPHAPRNTKGGLKKLNSRG